jgi:chemotaxis methyl-accepting protein methylase
VLAKEFEDEKFDLIFAKDSLKHIRQELKSELFEKFERWLKPGGRLVIAGN